MKTKVFAAALCATLALGAVPAEAHGGFWPGFALGAALSFLPPPVYYPPLVYAPPTPSAWYYPPGAPARLTPFSLQFDPGVQHAQAGLNAMGFGPLEVDGQLGPETYNAICRFQQLNGLVVDGVPGPAFFAVLDSQIRAVTPAPLPPRPPVAEGGGK